MPLSDAPSILEKYSGATIKVDSYFLKRTSFVANQTLLKLGEYNLTCIPAYLTFEGAQFLAVLTPSEVSLFSKFTTVTNILVLTFQNSDAKDLARFHIRVSLTGIAPIPERKNVCLLSVHFKAIPAELVQIFGEYLDEIDRRRASYESLAQTAIEITPETAAVMGYNNYAELLFAQERLKVKLKSLHSKQAFLILPEGSAIWVGRKPTQLKLYFRTAQLTLEGDLADDGAFSLPFSIDLLAILEEYLFRLSVVQKKKAQAEKSG